MDSRTLTRQRSALLALPGRRARGASLAAPVRWLGTDVLLLLSAAFLALSVFELAAWLAAAPLTTLIYSVALVPVALFLTSVVSARQR